MGTSLFNSFYHEGPSSATFIVEIDGKILGDFREVKGLGGKVEIFEVIEGGENNFIHKLPGRFTFDDVTLKRGITLDNGLFNWFTEASGDRFELGSRKGKATLARQDISITLVSATGKRLRMWLLQDAIPVSWSTNDLSIENDDFLVEELTIAHQGLSSVNLSIPGKGTKPNIKALKKVFSVVKNTAKVSKDVAQTIKAVKDIT
ncbi:MAG: phage tail protein [Actinomycetes bacterium]